MMQGQFRRITVMVIVNFSHPLTSAQLKAIERLSGETLERVIEVKTQYDDALPFAEQARASIEAVGLSSEEWQTLPLLINLPSLNVIAALLLAEMHGHAGYFPAVLRLRRIIEATTPQFEVAEILNLQAAREAARQMR
jgi:hypothetical protein